MIVNLFDADDGLKQFQPVDSVAVICQQILQDHFHAVVASPIESLQQRAKLSLLVINQQIGEDSQCFSLALRSPSLQYLPYHKIYKQLRFEENGMLIEHNLIGDMFKHLQNSLSDDPMMHFVPIAQQVLMMLEELIEEGEMMAYEQLQLRLVLVLENDAVGQGLHDGLCDLGSVVTALPSNDDWQHIVDHPVEQMQAIVCEVLVEAGNGVGEGNQTVGNVIYDLVGNVF